MLHGAVIRTFAQSDVENVCPGSGLPTVNALTDAEHPCQILADLFTIQEKLGDWRGKNGLLSRGRRVQRAGLLAVGGGPAGRFPAGHRARRRNTSRPPNCSHGWDRGERPLRGRPSRGRRGRGRALHRCLGEHGHGSAGGRAPDDLRGYGIDAALVARAKPGALVMHCLPAYRGKEITAEVLEAHADTIFTQAENRLHVQKAILSLLRGRSTRCGPAWRT